MLVKDIEIMGKENGLHTFVKKLFVLENNHFWLGGVKYKDVKSETIYNSVKSSDSIIGCWDSDEEWLVNKEPKITIDVHLDMPLMGVELNKKSKGVKRMNYQKFIKILETIYIDSFSSLLIGEAHHYNHKVIWREKENPFW
jgi:hypothetical protein